MAYGRPFADLAVRPELGGAKLRDLFAPLPFDVVVADAAKGASADQIAAAEALEVNARRALETAARPRYAPLAGMDAVGLALSGGGIRSATFCLGVVQVLSDKGLLGDVDFLSTVSGGGFVGAFVTRRRGVALDPPPWLDGATGGALGPDPDPVRYVRRNAKYLMVEHLAQRWTMAASGLAGLLLNWTPPLCLVALATWAYLEWGAGRIAPLALDDRLLSFAAAVSAFLLVVYGFAMRRSMRWAGAFGRIFAVALLSFVLIGAARILALSHPWLMSLYHKAWLAWGTITLGGIVTAVPTVLRYAPIARRPAVRARILKAALALAVLVLPALALLLFHVLLNVGRIPAAEFDWRGWSLADAPYLGAAEAPWVLVIGLIAGFVALFALNINLTGPHRLYRDRIANTFIRTNDEGSADIPLASINPGRRAPYHLINTALNLPSETSAALRARKCDFFLFSKEYCGSPSTGYARTGEWLAGRRRPIDLATAIAVSGAAVAPNMGLSSYPTLRAVLTLLNVRLNYWLLRPDIAPANAGGRMRALSRAARGLWLLAFGRAPGFVCLLREMTGLGMTSGDRWLCLSDGGHIENLGVYELLRRRCKFIVAVDAEQDGEFRFSGLTTVIRHAQIDFGIRILPDLDDLRPDEKTGLSRAHFAFCRILYPDPHPPGLLLYLKPSLTGNEDEMIKRYKLAHPEFPHSSTLDQFYDEEAFEMYRRLGAHVADGMFGRAITGGRTEPQTVAAWFRTLAVSLLAP
jgi:hypothetical protein